MRYICIAALAAAILPILMQASVAAEGLKVGPEITVCGDGPGGDVRGTPHVAFGRGVYLAVWREGWHGEGGAARICAARIDPQGKILDPKPIAVAPCKEGSQELPRVAFGGGQFLVVWQDFRNGKDNDVLGARISPEGKVLDERPLPIAAGPRTQSAPDVASDGTDFLVAWQTVGSATNAFHVAASLILASGWIEAPVDIRSPWTKAGACPRLAWDGEHYRLVFVSQSLLTLRLDRDGRPLDKEPVVTLRLNLGTGVFFAHSLSAAPGKGMLAVFNRSLPDYWGWGGPGAMIGLPVGLDGKPDASLPKESYPQAKLANWLDFGREKQEDSPWPYGPSAVAWDGRQYVAVWPRQHIRKTVGLANCDLMASRVDGWKPLDDTGVPVAASELEEAHPALASAGAGKLLCVYEKHAADGSVAIVARRLETQ